MVIVFDLDDTLYEELSYVRSGFKAVASFLSPLLHLEEDRIRKELYAEVLRQRDHVFDRFLKKYGVKSQKLVKECVKVYRQHEPEIFLFPDAASCLARLSTHPLYLVTDGNQKVQRRKIKALGLESVMKRCFCTYAYGRHRQKPSSYVFEKICDLENVAPSEVVYIADNPHKDFIGIKVLGFHTIRVLTGAYAHDKVDFQHEAEIILPNLRALEL